MHAALNSDTTAHPAVIDTHPASRPEPAVSKSKRFVSSFFRNFANIGPKMMVEIQLAAPATQVATMTYDGLLFSLSYETEKELPPLNTSQLQKSMTQPAVTNVSLAGLKRSSVFLSYNSRYICISEFVKFVKDLSNALIMS